MLKDFRQHKIQANEVFRLVIKTETFYCKLMAEEVFVFFNTKDGMSIKKLVNLRDLEKFSKSHAVLYDEIGMWNEFDENRDYETLRNTFNSLIQ